jgi:shikimate kinase
MSNLYLVGFMGAGKSAVGANVAGRLGRRFVDLDEQLEEQFGMSIAAVFAGPGEAEFRRAERQALERLSRLDGWVVAVGGGAFCDPANRAIMHSTGGRSVFLDVPWPVLAGRLAADHDGRPRYRSEEDAARLYRERRPHYTTATWIVPVDGSETVDEVVERVVDVVSGAACAT